MSGHPLWTKSSIRASVCVNLWLFKNISIQNLLFFFMFVIQRQFHLTTEVLFLEEKITWFMNSSYPLGICIELLLAHKHSSFSMCYQVLQGGLLGLVSIHCSNVWHSLVTPFTGLFSATWTNCLLQCLFCSNITREFLFSSSKYSFQWSLQVKLHWIYTRIILTKNIGSHKKSMFQSIFGNWRTMYYILVCKWVRFSDNLINPEKWVRLNSQMP